MMSLCLKYTLQIIAVISFVSIYSCSGNKSGEDDEFYSNDKSKLGIQVVDKDLGIKFYPPKNWLLMPSSLSKKIEARKGMVNTSDKFVYQPTYLFYDDSTKGILSIGKVTTSDTTLSRDVKLNYYKSIISSKYKNNELTVDDFSYSNISFTQFKFKKENLVSLKLIFENSKKEIVQLDYTILVDFQDSFNDVIKSSIGSIKLF